VTNRSAQRRTATFIVLIGAIVLLAALLLPWYSFNEAWSGGPVGLQGHQDATYYLALPSVGWAVQYSCGGFAAGCPSQDSYADAHQNSTGLIAGICFVLVSVGGVLGVLAGILGVVQQGTAQRLRPTLVLALLATILGFSAGLLFAAALPGAFSSDFPAELRPGTTSGPWSSFYGSGFGSILTVGYNLSWGPLIGWYLSVAAAAILLVGVTLLLVHRHDPPEPVPVALPAAQEVPAASPVPAPQSS
jgi:MFS family permease